MQKESHIVKWNLFDFKRNFFVCFACVILIVLTSYFIFRGTELSYIDYGMFFSEGPDWNNYRIGDFFYVNDPKLREEWKHEIKKDFSNTIMGEYYNLTNKTNQHNILLSIIDRKIKFNPLKYEIPSNDSLVIHLRLGDSIDKCDNFQFYLNYIYFNFNQTQANYFLSNINHSYVLLFSVHAVITHYRNGYYGVHEYNGGSVSHRV